MVLYCHTNMMCRYGRLVPGIIGGGSQTSVGLSPEGVL